MSLWGGGCCSWCWMCSSAPRLDLRLFPPPILDVRELSGALDLSRPSPRSLHVAPARSRVLGVLQ